MGNEQTWQRQVADTWDEAAKNWDRRSVQMWEEGSRKQIVPLMKRHLPEGSKLIDIGCGNGYGTYKLHQAGFSATGIDLSAEMIRLAKEQFARERLNYFTAQLSDVTTREETYDGALLINVFEWMESPRQALEELRSILKEDGYVCLTIFGPTAGPRQYSYPRLLGEDTVFQTIMPWEFEQLASTYGFTIVDEYGVHKKDVPTEVVEKLSKALQQAVSFMWVYLLQKQ